MFGQQSAFLKFCIGRHTCDGLRMLSPLDPKWWLQNSASISHMLCYDYFERIFIFLDLQSLLCVAQTYKELRIATVGKFGSDFSRKKALQPDCSFSEWHESNDVILWGFKHSWNFVHCFRANISYLGNLLFFVNLN